MDWSRFLMSIDWPTESDAHIDIIFENLMKMNLRERLVFLETWESVDEHRWPKGFEEIVSDIKQFRKEYKSNPGGSSWQKS